MLEVITCYINPTETGTSPVVSHGGARTLRKLTGFEIPNSYPNSYSFGINLNVTIKLLVNKWWGEGGGGRYDVWFGTTNGVGIENDHCQSNSDTF